MVRTCATDQEFGIWQEGIVGYAEMRTHNTQRSTPGCGGQEAFNVGKFSSEWSRMKFTDAATAVYFVDKCSFGAGEQMKVGGASSKKRRCRRRSDMLLPQVWPVQPKSPKSPKSALVGPSQPDSSRYLPRYFTSTTCWFLGPLQLRYEVTRVASGLVVPTPLLLPHEPSKAEARTTCVRVSHSGLLGFTHCMRTSSIAPNILHATFYILHPTSYYRTRPTSLSCHPMHQENLPTTAWSVPPPALQ